MTTRNSYQLAVLVLLCWTAPCPGQGTFEPILITFDGPPVVAPGTGILVQEYFESGMSFTPIDPNAPWAAFARIGRNPALSGLPDNGTAYLQAGVGSTLTFTFTNGWQFSLLGVDLAEYSTVVPDAVTVRFVGYRSDGSVVTTDLTTDGIIDGTGPLADFETFQFGAEWNGLTRVEIPTFGWSLDNLVVAVPEPSVWALISAGGLLFWARRRRREK